ncbi:polymeric immunoglobulin receptor-like isoform X2 [Pseudochaenichthys georgianus]|uniref:polymeric immunoglobulin receptor-like isoform X2 n=1 Tax=Pseudochaenichthys georgianus TaxID=52239 RepID=UPI00146A5AA6|nr:polymeric immunoglobulin receptor-like isoform X2 [Pseudochaenichthys georgianus]
MKVSHTLICFFLLFCEYFSLFSSLQGNTGLASAQLSLYSVTEGEEVRVICFIPSYRGRKFFCKEKCEEDDILIETTDAEAYQSGRYSIDHKQKDFVVTITQLTKSDSGKYGCGSAASSSRNSSTFIEIIVVDAKLDGGPSAEKTIDARTGGNIVVECSFTRSGTRMYFCKEECEGDILVETTSNTYALKSRYSIRHVKGGFVFVSIKQLTQSDSGWYRCGLRGSDSKDPYQRFRLIVTDALTTSTPSSSVSSASSTTTNQSESSTTTPASPKTTEHPETTKGVVLYGRLTLVVLVIVSSLSVSVLVFCRKRICKAKKPREETLCASAPEAEDDPSQPAYSEIKFVSVGSSHSGFHGDAECVIYSVPRVEASSDEPPLYSTVNNPQ